MNFIKAIVAAGMVAASTSAFAADITGAGATFPYPLYSKWADAYKKETGNGLNYQSIGSGAGIKQIIAKTVTFGASDMPLKPEQLEKEGMIQWPQAMGALVPVVNLEGIKAGEMVFTGELLADIYLGKVKTWNDPAIAKLNPKLKLPTDAITVVRRSDGSGTTFLWTDYLSKVSADWKSKVGSGTAVEWPAGVGAKGNEGVAGNVSQTKNSIGYVEYAYAKQNKLTYGAVINKAGKTVQPTIGAFQAAAANADWASAKNYYVILTDQPGDASWPITGATFILMHKEPVDKSASSEAIKFFTWAFEKGAKMAEELDYIPMPDSVVKQIEKTWSSEIKS
ncbi:phosphate ABC transporter substrate-binding protein PstS [Rhodopseudomonas palustris]|uniref:Phosphate-binding protein PstS n=1 Tax=Rhodopseudomonas palustris (strain DX-1) TaxID=652103 RepID=E6VH08_RHOPX|nr:phosphate ABC transporter substrate-binding protein PstS [Rhodopseudomonas palustris]